ncbi:hypothetical protein [Glycomyces sp. NPDC021274]|uniref:hypothetical protein n=1 Tax=Glycomyces sp. NPDC021274 TaxID=3155120 RepID=UPI0033CCB61F
MSYQPDPQPPYSDGTQPGVPPQHPDQRAQPGVQPQGLQSNPHPYAPGPVGPSGLTAEEEAQHRQLVLAGIGLLVVPILLAIILSAVDAPIDPRFTGPVFSAVLIAGAATLGKAYRFKRDTKRR